MSLEGRLDSLERAQLASAPPVYRVVRVPEGLSVEEREHWLREPRETAAQDGVTLILVIRE